MVCRKFTLSFIRIDKVELARKSDFNDDLVSRRRRRIYECSVSKRKRGCDDALINEDIMRGGNGDCCKEQESENYR